jgi:hypothetical protein
MAAAAPVVSTVLRLIPSLTPPSYRATNSRRAWCFRCDDSKDDAPAPMVLPVSYWKLSEGEIFKYLLSIAMRSAFRSCVQQPGY